MTKRSITSPSSGSRRSRQLNRSGVIDRAHRKKRSRTVATTPPPVVTRYRVMGMSKPISKRGEKVRKRYDIPLNPPGSEMRLPALPQLHIGWRAVSFLMTVALGLILYQIWYAPYFRVMDVQVSGINLISRDEVIAAMDVIGKQIFVVDPEQIESVLLNTYAEFMQVKTEINIPDKVKIIVTERTPVLIWHQGDIVRLVDNEGLAMPMRSGLDPAAYLVIEALGDPPSLGLSTNAVTSAAGSSQVSSLSAVLPELVATPSVTPFLTLEMIAAIKLLAGNAPQGTTLIYHPEHGLGWSDSRGWNVYFGDASDMEMKLLVYQSMVENLEREGLRPKLISVEFVHAPYYRLKK